MSYPLCSANPDREGDRQRVWSFVSAEPDHDGRNPPSSDTFEAIGERKLAGYEFIDIRPRYLPISLLCGLTRIGSQSRADSVQVPRNLRRHILVPHRRSQTGDGHHRSRGHSARVEDQCGELPEIRNPSKTDGPLPGKRSAHDPWGSLAHAAASHPDGLRSKAARCAVLHHAGLPCRVAAGFRQTGPQRPCRYLPPADENYFRHGRAVAIWRTVEG